MEERGKQSNFCSILWILTIGLLVTALLVPSNAFCQKAKYGGTLRVGLSYDPISLSCMMVGGDPGVDNFTSNLYDGILEMNFKDSSLQQGLGTEWKQVDDLTWEVKLRKGVPFHKGYGEMTAEDVAFTMNYILEKNMRSKFAVTAVKNAEIVDPYTVRYRLNQPFAPFTITGLTPTAAGMVVSKKAFSEIGPEKFLRNPVGTGPFEFVRWISGSEVEIKKFNNYYRKGFPYLDRVIFKIIPDDFIRQNMLINGELDLIEAPDWKNLAQIEKNPKIAIYRTPGHNWDYIAFNMTGNQHMNPALKDKRVRQAVAYAIDREDIIKAIYYGYATPTDQPIAPSITGSRPGPLKYPYKANLEKARQLLKEAGYPNGFEVTCITSSKTWLRRETELIAAQLARVGIRVKIDALDMSTFDTRRVKEKRFEMLLEDISNPSADPDSTIYWFHHTGTAAYFGPPDKPFNPELEALLDKGRAVTDPKKRLPIYHSAVDKILDDTVYIYICHVDWITAAHKYVKNYIQPPTSKKLFGEVWLDK